ncbi:Ubiquitin carboxyl-terminal hydrolase 7 [Hamiltosporidium tvaerminnensis]|nr:Ubiquitin carboxyl-terminal hydrolase 7 [Hamiltosporidium tvaerminnensis]
MDGSNKDIRDNIRDTRDNIRDTRDNIRDTRDNTTDNIRDNNTTTLTYNLHSVVVHSGTAHDGHYTAIINIKGNYYKFNDTIVTPVCKEEALECNYGGVHPYKNKVRVSNAYMLVYRRVGDNGLDNFIDNSSIRDIGSSNRDIRDKDIDTNPNPNKCINTNPNPNKCINTNPNPTINTNPTTITYPNTTPTIPLPIKYPIPTTTLHPLLLSTFKKEFKDKIIYIFFKPINIGIKGNIIIIRLKMEDDYREKVREIYGVYRKYLYMFEVSNSDSVVGGVGMYNDIDNNLVGMDNNIGNIDNNIVNSNTLGNSNIDNINIGNNIGNSNIDNNIDKSNINNIDNINIGNNINNVNNKHTNINNIDNTTTYPTLSYTTTVKDKGIYFAYLSDNEYNFNNNKDYLLFTKKYKEIPLCKYNNKGVLIDCEVKVIRRDMIGGVNNSSILEGVNNRDILEGVNNSSKEEGVKDKSSSYKGVSKSSKEEGVNNVSNVQQGVNSSSNIQQGVNNVSNVQQGVNNSSNIQQGVNNSSNIQQGVNNSSKEEGVNNSSKEEGVSNSSKEKGVNNSSNIQEGVNNVSNVQHPVNNSTTVQHPFTNTNIFIEHQSISYVIYIYGDKEKIKKYLESYRRGKEVELEYIDSNIDSNDNSNMYDSIEKYICYGRKGKANIKIKYFIRDRDSSVRDSDRDSDKYSSISDRDNSKYIKTKDKETNEYNEYKDKETNEYNNIYNKETNEYNNIYNIYNTLNDLKMYLCCDKVRLLDGKVIIPKVYWLIKVFINNEEGYNINRVRHKHIMCVKRGVKVKEFIESVKRVGIECGVIRSIMGSDKGSKDMLEGVSDIGKEEGVSNSGTSYKGVSNSGSSYKGVSDSSKEEGVSNCGSSYKGVINSSSSYKGVSNNIDKQHPVNNNTDTQHPVINNTLYPVNNNTLHPVRVLGVRKGCMYLKVLDGDEYVEEVMVIERCYMGRYIKGCYLRGCSVIGYCFLIPFKESERIIEFKRRMGVVSRVIRCNGEGFYVMEDNEVMEVSNEEYVMMEV